MKGKGLKSRLRNQNIKIYFSKIVICKLKSKVEILKLKYKNLMTYRY